MRIGINALSILPDGGVATYATNLFDELLAGGTDDEYLLVCSTVNEQLFRQYESKSVSLLVVPVSTQNSAVRVLLEQLLIPLVLLWWRADLLFAPRNIVPALTPTPSVVVMHSMHLNYAYGIDDISLFQRIYGRVVLPLTIRKATRIIAISETVCTTLADRLPVDERDINVVYHGAGIEPNRDETVTDPPACEGVDRPYVLFLSQLVWHKNAHKLIDAFARLKTEYETDHTLVIAGKDINGNRERLERRCQRLGVRDDVAILGRIPQEAVTPLYAAADVFVYPSAIEGFGFPPLEAMANGTPVIGSNRTSVPEILDDAGIVVEPDDIDRLASAMYQLTTDDERREKLIERGYDRVEEFSWAKTGKQTAAILADAAALGKI